MKIIFHIEYHTVFGEELVLNVPTNENHAEAEQLRMSTTDGRWWTYTMNIPTRRHQGPIRYFYSMISDGRRQRKEWRSLLHEINTENTGATLVNVFDRWTDMPEDTYLYSSAFTECVSRKGTMGVSIPSKKAKAAKGRVLRVKVRAPQLLTGQYLVLVGGLPVLGAWEPTKGIVMTECAPNVWQADLNVTEIEKSAECRVQSAKPFSNAECRVQSAEPTVAGRREKQLAGADGLLKDVSPNSAFCIQHSALEKDSALPYKFVAMKPSGQPMWETGANRNLIPAKNEAEWSLESIAEGELLTVEVDQAFFEISNTRLAGTLIPVFSLRSEKSFGVGDFGDLKRMVDWVASTGQRCLQILPINDSTTTHTWTDSYPYSCISIFALHPQYADLTQMPPIADATKREEMESLRKELNALPQIDYERVNNAKNEYLRIIFGQVGAETLKSDDFKKFFADNERWLVPYARYSQLRDLYGTADFTSWPEHNTWSDDERKALTSTRTKLYKEVSFFYWVQYVLCRQLEAAHAYARSKHVVLKGDIPIGVNRMGCDVWQEPHYFNLNGQAGAPPDDFSVNGQNWGFPTYNWERMMEDGCLWWVRRFQNMNHYFDAYRIDHVLGFFRIWEIPLNSVHGLLGQFAPSLGMSRGEIENYGLRFQEELFTQPFIADWTLERLFASRADEVKEKYLDHQHDDIWQMKPEYNTQRKIEAAFAEATEPEKLSLRDGLYSLVSNVLFVRDRKDANLFHPRIAAQQDFMYEALYEGDKRAFNNLYNDYYYRRNSQFWYREAMHKLPRLVEATRMLVCAEDLGMVPECVPWVMNELRILSLEVQSMPKDPMLRFGVSSQYPYRSVCTLSSHDMPTLRQWWDEDLQRTQLFYSQTLHRTGEAPHPLPGWLARDIIADQLASPSMLCILSLQDWLAIDEKLRLADANGERINIPANPKHYWRYRMHLTIEQLLENKEFTNNIRNLIADHR